MVVKAQHWYMVTFTALVEAEDEAHAQIAGESAAESIEEYIGTHASGDPSIYETKCTGVALFTDKLPWVAAEEAYRESRAQAQIASRLVPPGHPHPPLLGTSTHCEHGAPYANWRACTHAYPFVAQRGSDG